MSKPIILEVAYKRPTKELATTVQFTVSVDRSFKDQIVRMASLDPDTPLKVTIEEITDPDAPRTSQEKPADEATKNRRNSYYQQVLMICKEAGINDEERKKIQKEVVGVESMKEMTETQLNELILCLRSDLSDKQLSDLEAT